LITHSPTPTRTSVTTRLTRDMTNLPERVAPVRGPDPEEGSTPGT
jgi:hypothetical protein